MSDQLEILKIVARRLKKESIRYMVSGSVAMNFYAQPRMTRDIDIIVDLQRKDADRPINLFRQDFYIDGDAVRSAIRRQGIFNVIHLDRIVKVDFIVRQESAYRRREFERRRRAEIEGVELWLVSAEDLVLSKVIWARDSRSEVQLNDARNLLESVADLDLQYHRELGAAVVSPRPPPGGNPVKDTSYTVAERYRKMLMERSGTERLKMGLEMFDAARSLILASPNREQETSPSVKLLLRCYGSDLDEKALSAVLQRLK